nr:hypothetical protein Iba_chr05bCG8660 [Ipomoea batatas]
MLGKKAKKGYNGNCFITTYGATVNILVCGNKNSPLFLLINFRINSLVQPLGLGLSSSTSAADAASRSIGSSKQFSTQQSTPLASVKKQVLNKKERKWEKGKQHDTAEASAVVADDSTMLSSISVEPLFPFLGPIVETEFPNALRELQLEVDDADPNAKPGPLEAPKAGGVVLLNMEAIELAVKLNAPGVALLDKETIEPPPKLTLLDKEAIEPPPKLNNAVGVVVVLEEEEVVELPLKLKTLRVALLYKGALQDEEAIELPLKL